MSCCEGWYLSKNGGVVGECPDCGGETIDGYARHGCSYSSVDCETCGAATCYLNRKSVDGSLE